MDDLNPERILQLAKDPYQWVQWLNDVEFIDTTYRNCNVCRGRVTLEINRHAANGVLLRCTKYRCKTSQAIQNGSYFEQYRCNICTVLRAILIYAHGDLRTSCAYFLDLHRETVAKIYDDLESRIIHNVMAHPVAFHRKGVYEADETYLEHVKLHDGSYMNLLWIGGIMHRDSGKVVLYTLPDRSADTLLHKITTYIPEGSLVCTDSWKSYIPMPNVYTHRSVNHSKGEYARTEDVPGYGRVCVTTNHLESMWHRYRRFLENRQLRTTDRVVSGNNVFMFNSTPRSVLDLIKLKK